MNDIHASAIIGDDVELGAYNVIGPFAVILGPARLGDRNWVGPHVVIGTPAEIKGIDHGAGWSGALVGGGIQIGNGNVFREYTAIHQGHYAMTTIGDDCYLMNKVYIGHDGVIGDSVSMASMASLGGHVQVGDGANLGIGVIVHQRRILGPVAMIGMGAVVTRDVPPFALAYGNPCRVRGANRVGMRRAGVPEPTIDTVHAAYITGQTATDPQDGVTGDAWAWWASHTDPELS